MSDYSDYSSYDENGGGGGKSKAVIGGIILVLFLIGGGLAAFFALGNKGSLVISLYTINENWSTW